MKLRKPGSFSEKFKDKKSSLTKNGLEESILNARRPIDKSSMLLRVEQERENHLKAINATAIRPSETQKHVRFVQKDPDDSDEPEDNFHSNTLSLPSIHRKHEVSPASLEFNWQFSS